MDKKYTIIGIRIVLIITIIIIILTIKQYLQIENYDAKIKNIDEKMCADSATTSYDSNAFAYDPKTKSCYISKEPILAKPLASLYNNEYKADQHRCNKLKNITANEHTTNIDLVKNATYGCANNETDSAQMFLIDPKPNSIKKPITMDQVTTTKIDNYYLRNINWPTLQDDPLNQIPPTVHLPKLSTDVNGFKYSKNEYLGAYIYDQKCVVNVSLDDCLNFCSNNNECVGTEWNPILLKNINNKTNYYDKKINSPQEYNVYKDVCCPKKVIKEIIPRRLDYVNGSFYVKNPMNNILDPDRTYIII
jgi:hypothetical protein